MSFFRRAWVLALAIYCFGIASAHALTTITGPISTTTRWTTADSPYLLSGEVAVTNGADLTIDAGVTLYMGPAARLTVQSGSVLAQGSPSQPIRVLSVKVHEGAQPSPGDWGSWTFEPGTRNTTRLEHVLFEHGSGLFVRGSAPELNNLTIRNQSAAAISVDLQASPFGIGNRAEGNALNAIVVPAGDIVGSTRWGLRGIPYLIQSGVVSVGASPALYSVSPRELQAGDSGVFTLTGSRLTGLSQVASDHLGLSFEVQPGATDTTAQVLITADGAAAQGLASLEIVADAGVALLGSVVTIKESQPLIKTLAPAVLYTGQGGVPLTVNGLAMRSDTQVLVDGVAVETQFVSSTRLNTTVSAPLVPSTMRVSLRSPDAANPGQFITSASADLPVLSAALFVTPSTASVFNASSTTLTVALPYPAPAGGLDLNVVSSVPSVATVPSTLHLDQGQSTVSLPVNAVGLGNSVITVSRVGFAAAQASLQVLSPPSLSVSPSALTLGVGRVAQLTIQSSDTAPVGGLPVSLVSSNPAVLTVPASATIPAGTKTVAVQLSSVAEGVATVTASAANHVMGQSSVNVRPLSIVLPSGSLVAPGLSRSIPVTLSDPAPEGGLPLTLSSENPSVASVPNGVVVPAGQSSVNFALTGVAAGVTSMTASAPGHQSASMPVTVEAVAIGVGSPGVSSLSLPKGMSRQYAVTLSRPAPVGGVTVHLNMADPAVASVSPSSVSIAQGETSGGVVQIEVRGVEKGSTSLTASGEGLNSLVLPVTVTSPVELQFSRTTDVVGKGMNSYWFTVQRTVNGSAFTGVDPLVVNLSSSDPSKASVPASVTIPGGSSSVSFQVTGVDLTGDTAVIIDATAAGYIAPATKVQVQVAEPVLSLVSVNTDRSVGQARNGFYVRVRGPAASPYPSNQEMAQSTSVAVAVVEANPAGLVDGIYSASTGGSAITQVVVAAGGTNSNYGYVGTPTMPGSYKVSASATGMATATSPVVTVSAPALQFSRTTDVVGKGMNSYWFTVQRTVNGSAFTGVDPLVVNLSSSDPSKASVPASVTIPGGSSSVSFQVTGVDLTGDTAVIIDATAAGYIAPATKVQVQVAEPVLSLVSVNTDRSVGQARNGFYVRVRGPAASPYPSNQEMAQSTSVAVAVVEANPAGLVDGIYSASTGGSAITQVVVAAGGTNSNYGYVGTPTMPGSYKVSASATGMATATSPVVTVSAPALQFSRTTDVVGKGMNSYWFTVQRTVNGSAFTGVDPLVVNLSSSDPSKASVPASVTIPGGSSSVSFQVTGVDLTGDTAVIIDATAAGYIAPATKVQVQVAEPVLSLVSVNTDRSVGQARNGFYVRVRGPAASPYPSNQEMAQSTSVAVAVVEANPAGLVDGIYSASTGGSAITQVVVAAGGTNSNYGYVGTPTMPGSYKVSASATGMATATSPVVTVSAPALQFSRTTDVVGKGMNSYTFTVQRVVDGSVFTGVDALTVQLACSAPTICSVPATVTIPAGGTSASFVVTGVGVGDTTVTASATGYTAAADLSIRTALPQLVFSGPSSTTVGGQSNFSVSLRVPGSGYSTYQTLAQEKTINLVSSEPGVATVPTTATIAAGANSTSTLKLSGVAAGSTSVTASGTDMLSATSAVVNVAP